MDPGSGEIDQTVSSVEERFERWRRRVGLPAGPAAGLLVWLLPLAGLTPDGHRLAAIVSGAVVWWITEAVPIPVTALFASALTVVFGLSPAQAALAPYASPTIFLFMGSFILGEAITVHGLDRRISGALLSVAWVGRSDVRVRMAVGALAVTLSAWMSNTATAAMLLPMAIGLAGGRAATGQRSPATGLMLVLAYAASIGGVATPVGSPPNLITIGMLEQLAGVEIDFFRWMALGVPIALIGYVTLVLLTGWLYPGARTAATRGAAAALRVGTPWTRGEVNCIIAFATAVVLWLIPGIAAIGWGASSAEAKWLGSRFDEGVVAIIAASLLFMLPVNWKRREFTVSWRQAVRIDWGTILLFGGGLSLGRLMFETGLAEAVGRGVLDLSGASSLWSVTAVMLIVAVLTTEMASNTAAANMLVPVAIAVAKTAGVSPVPPALAVGLGASMAFMLPISTPPNAIVYGTGRVPITSMISCGVLLDAVMCLVVLAVLYVLCPVLGLV